MGSSPQAVQTPLPLVQKPAAYVSFSAEVNINTAEQLQALAANIVGQGHPEIHLLLSTPGGAVQYGITIYNFLLALPIKVVTHNLGNVDSIGLVIYLAGSERYACPHTTFMLHGVAMQVPAPTSLFEKNFQESLARLTADQARIKGIYSERSKVSPEQAEGLFLQETTLSAEEAVSRGIVHEIRQLSIPPGSPVLQLVFNR
jgi:ATP-dependent Clp protease, protease subunit